MNLNQEKEIRMIRRGKVDELNNIHDRKMYLNYLQAFKKESIAELKKEFQKEGIFGKYFAGGIQASCGIVGTFFTFLSFTLGQIPFVLLSLTLAAIGIAIPDLILFYQAKKEYEKDVSKLQEMIVIEEEQKQSEEPETKRDAFITEIEKEMEKAFELKYDGSDTDIKILYLLAREYLRLKRKLKAKNPADVLSQNVELNMILLNMETNIMANRRRIETQKEEQTEPESTLQEKQITSLLMNDTELLEYMPNLQQKLARKKQINNG